LSLSLGEMGWKAAIYQHRISFFFLVSRSQKLFWRKWQSWEGKKISWLPLNIAEAVQYEQCKSQTQINMKYPCKGITKATGNVRTLVTLFKYSRFLKWGILGKRTEENEMSGLQPEERKTDLGMSSIIKYTSIALNVCLLECNSI